MNTRPQMVHQTFGEFESQTPIQRMAKVEDGGSNAVSAASGNAASFTARVWIWWSMVAQIALVKMVSPAAITDRGRKYKAECLTTLTDNRICRGLLPAQQLLTSVRSENSLSKLNITFPLR